MAIVKLFRNTTFTWLLVSTIVIGVIVGNVVLALKTIDDLAKTQSSLINSADVLVSLDNLHIMVLSAETGQRGFLLTEIEEYLTPYQAALNEVNAQVEVVKKMHSEIPGQGQKITELLLLVRDKLSELSETVQLALADKEKRALKQVMTGRGRNLYREIQKYLVEIENSEIAYRDSLFAKRTSIQQEARVTFIISAITSSLLLLGMMLLARINITSERKNRENLEQQNQTLLEEVKKRTSKLKLYSEELQRSNRELEDFAFVASHDLQEPLRKIRAFGDRLQTTYIDTLDAKGLDYIKRMRNAAERMSNLITDLLEFSRVSSRGKEFASVDLNKILTVILDDLELAIIESKATISTCDLPTVEADSSQMYQLLLNLISNAIKFRNTDVPPLITLSYSMEERPDDILDAMAQWHVINISDNGIGFEQEYADKIFSPFQRLHSRADYKGTGIGLAVCRRIVERHRGKIFADSALTKGASFTILMPVELIPLGLDGDIIDAE